MSANKNYKDSVFTTLFNNPDLLRELYSALEGITLPQDVPVSINTLKNALIMDRYNDISFEIGGKLVILIEHQSTINPNMALRLLMYITEIYERMIQGRNIYSDRHLSIPWPEFYVLYNGTSPFPDNEVLRLSDMFEKPQDLGLPIKANPLLELEVKVININEGRNETIVQRCPKLHEYSALTARINEYKQKMGNLKEAIEEAIKFCHKNDILKEYLEHYGSEVLNMLYTEFNIEDAKAVWREEAHEDGREKGLKEGRMEGREAGQKEVLELLTQKLSKEEIEEIKLRLSDKL